MVGDHEVTQRPLYGASALFLFFLIRFYAQTNEPAMQILQITAGGGGGGCFGGVVLPRPLKDVAVVGKIRFGVELMFSLVVFSEIPLLFSHNHSLETNEILFFSDSGFCLQHSPFVVDS